MDENGNVNANGFPITIGQGTDSGDLNSDGKVDITDVQVCVNHVLGVQDWGTNADVNSDGAVNVLDVQAIVNIILGG